MVKIVITVEGGIIQTISSDDPVEIYIIDYDTEGEDNNPHLTKFGGNDCILYRGEEIIDPGFVTLAKKTWETARKDD